MTNEAKKEARLKALTLLRKYDRLRAELRELEPKLQDACNAYARTKGMTFMRPDSFRCEMEITYEMTLKKKAA